MFVIFLYIFINFVIQNVCLLEINVEQYYYDNYYYKLLDG